MSLYIKGPRLKRPFWNVPISNIWFQMVPTILNQNILNGHFCLGRFVYKDKMYRYKNDLGLSGHFVCSDLEWLGLNHRVDLTKQLWIIQIGIRVPTVSHKSIFQIELKLSLKLYLNQMFFCYGLGAFINDVTQIWPKIDPPLCHIKITVLLTSFYWVSHNLG